MVRKPSVMVPVLVLILVGVILCVVVGAFCGFASCVQATLPIPLLLLPYLFVYKLAPQIPVIAGVITGPPRQPPRLT